MLTILTTILLTFSDVGLYWVHTSEHDSDKYLVISHLWDRDICVHLQDFRASKPVESYIRKL